MWVCVFWPTCVCVARRGRWCQYELAGLAVGRPNNRLQQVRGAFNTSKHTGRAAHWCQISRETSHADQQLSEGHLKLICCCSAFFLRLCFTLLHCKQNPQRLNLWTNLWVQDLFHLSKIKSNFCWLQCSNQTFLFLRYIHKQLSVKFWKKLISTGNWFKYSQFFKTVSFKDPV